MKNLKKATNYTTPKEELDIYYTTDCPNLSFNSSANIPNLLAVAVISSICLLYTSDAADDSLRVDLGGRRIIKKIF